MERDEKTLARLQELVSGLIEKRIVGSLGELDRTLDRWRRGELSALSAHGAVLRHVARCETTVEKVMGAAEDRPEGLMREALAQGLISDTDFTSEVGKAPSDVAGLDAFVDEDAPATPDKRATVEALLAQGPILLHLDPRRPGVEVPARFHQDPSLRLRFGYGLAPAIADLCVDEAGVSGTLSFGGLPFHCVIPWHAVFAVQIDGDTRGAVWPDDVPDAALREQAEADAAEAAAEAAAEPIEVAPKKKGGHLRLVE